MNFKKVIKKNNYEVTVVLNLLKHAERMKIIKDLNFKVDEKGEAVKNTSDSIDQLEKLTEILKQRCASIHIVCQNKTYSSFEEIEYFEEYSEIINDLISTLLAGVKMGEA